MDGFEYIRIRTGEFVSRVYYFQELLPLILLLEVINISTASPVSFPTERPESKDEAVDGRSLQTPDDGDPDGRSYVLHQLKKKKKRQKINCLLALQQYSNRYRRAAPANQDEQGRTFFWGGLNYYNTDIHVYNGGYGNKPSFSPGEQFTKII